MTRASERTLDGLFETCKHNGTHKPARAVLSDDFTCGELEQMVLEIRSSRRRAEEKHFMDGEVDRKIRRLTDDQLAFMATCSPDLNDDTHAIGTATLRAMAIELQGARAGQLVAFGGDITDADVAKLRRAVEMTPPAIIITDVQDPAPYIPIDDQELAWICLALTWYPPRENSATHDELGASLADKVVVLRNVHDTLTGEISELRERLRIAEQVKDDARTASASDLEQRRELDDRIQTIADEKFGPFPVQTADENLSAIERGISDEQARIANAITALEQLRGALLEEYPPRMAHGMIDDIVMPLLKRGDMK